MKKQFKKFLSIMLSVAVLLSCVIISGVTVSASTGVESYISDLGLTIGEELINEPFNSGDMSASVSGSANPMPNTAVTGWEFSDSASGALWEVSGKVGKFSIKNGQINTWAYDDEAAFIMPAITADNFVLTAKVKHGGTTYTDRNFGIITGIDGSLATANASQRFSITYDASSSNKDVTAAFVRKGTNSQNNSYATLSKTYSVANYIEIAMVRYEGRDYYFIDGDYITSLAVASVANERIGFFVMKADIYVDDIVVNKLNDAVPTLLGEDYAEGLGAVVGDVLLCEPFESGNMSASVAGSSKPMPNTAVTGWEFTDTASGALYHNGDGKFRINGGQINMWAYNGDAAFIMPALSTDNYIVSAKVKASASNASSTLGFLTEIDTDFATTTSSSRFGIVHNKSNSNAVTDMFTRVGTNSQLNVYATLTKNYTLADYITISMVSYEGVNYFFVNGDYITSKAKTGLANERVGFFVFQTDAYFDDIYVKALSKGASPEELKLEEIGAILGSELINEPFSSGDMSASVTGSANPIPNTAVSGWEFADTSRALWHNGDGKFLIKNGVMNMWCYNSDAAFILPDLKTSNYKITAKVKGAGNNASANLGFLTDVDGSLSEATTSRRFAIEYDASGATKTVKNMYTRLGTDSNKNVYATLSGSYSVADYITISMISYNGINYYFVNGEYVMSQEKTNLDSERIGLFVCRSDSYFDDIVVTELLDKENPISGTDAISVNADSVQYADLIGNSDENAAGLRINTSLDLENDIFNTEKEITAGVIIKITDDILYDARQMVKDGLPLEDVISVNVATDQNETIDLLGIAANVDDYFVLRAFITVDGKYYYSDAVMVCPAFIAEEAYLTSNDENVKEKINSVYGFSEKFQGADSAPLTFTSFADFHYKEEMYASTIADLESIFERADQTNSAFVMSLGDFSNSLRGSPELSNTFLNSTYSNGNTIPAYNLYGNHELETDYNSDALKYVTDRLTNQANNVVWGTADGKPSADGSIGYYYFDVNGYRMVCVDANYSWNEAGEYWQHNQPGSWGAPSGNIKSNSLGDVQLKWLENVLLDAADKGISCVVATHQSFQPNHASCRDAETVRGIFRKVNNLRKGTVLMSIAGHSHINSSQMYEGVFYVIQTATRNYAANIVLDEADRVRYSDDVKYVVNRYDNNGNFIGTKEISINELSGAGVEYGTYFTKNPLSAVITIDRAGNITIEGSCEPADKNNIESGYNDISYGTSNPIHINQGGSNPWQDSYQVKVAYAAN